MNHTPGPWSLGSHEGRKAVVGGDDLPVLLWPRGDKTIRSEEERQANATLIAAAPAFKVAWALVPEEIKGRIFDIFDALHKPDSSWVEEAINGCS